jgi:hypothetical protein
MALTYKEKMSISQRLLEAMRLRLSGKQTELLPPEGVNSLEDPAEVSLVGGLAPRPDPDYHREQAPSAMGMVLMVTPNTQGQVTFSLQGRFDVTHRYIPSLQIMLSHIQVDVDGDKSRQKLPEYYKRFTVTFSEINFTLDVNNLNIWKEAELKSVLGHLQEEWKNDRKIFRHMINVRTMTIWPT